MGKWKLLWDNSQEKLDLSNLAYDRKHYNSIVENCFLAVELCLKALILKEFPDTPDNDLWGHSLSNLIRYRNSYLRKKLSRDKAVYKLLIELISDDNAWSPADRYYGKGDEKLAEKYLNNSKRIVKWIGKNFLKN